ncbi:hypothetical protein CA260_04915 [Dyella jiangningensis]|uniref:Flagellar hook-length control protein-like C-terminal domain-containing protein n=1 Tax=Dyella jiangningensis TaxID=1379159 RepID=A0A328P7D3_9GAMM|nr:hypothetical protein CA260_04915 [Dyella jiangningensis]
MGHDAKPAAKAPGTDAQASSDAQDKSGKDDATPSAVAPDPATAMLALLGQSIPAQAAAAPAAETAGKDEATASPLAATLPAGLQAMPNLQGQAAPAPGLQADGDDMLDSKGIGALKDDAADTTTAVADESEETPATFADALSAMAKDTSQASQPASNSHDHPLDALNSLMTAPLPSAQPTASAAPAAHALTMQSSAGTPAFAQELGQQVAWLGGQDIKQARIRLHPEDLGQLDVKVSVKQDHVDVSFIAQHPQAVHAVQQTLGQLDTLLAHHGLSLGHAEVGQGGRGNESGQGASSAGVAHANTDDSQESGGISAVAAPVIKAIGLLDTFA